MTKKLFNGALLAAMAVQAAFPVTTGVGSLLGGGLPWELPLQRIGASISGPVAASVGIIGFVVAGCSLVFGQDWGHFAKGALITALAVAFVVAATGFMTSLYGVTAVVI